MYTGEAFSYYVAGRNYGNSWVTPAGQYFKFRARSCNDANFFLTSTAGVMDSSGFQIVIGGYQNQVGVQLHVILIKVLLLPLAAAYMYL